MKRLLSQTIIGWLVIVLFIGFLITGAKAATSDEKANELFVESFLLVESAKEAEKTSYVIAFEHLNNALANLETIVVKYPSSNLDVKLLLGKVLIGGYTFKEFSKTILPRAKIASAAEGNILACSYFIAKEDSDESDDEELGYLLGDITFSYMEIGDYNEALRVIS